MTIIVNNAIAINDCCTCKFFNLGNKKKNTCKAFPKGIPEVIFIGERSHKQPYPGDNGIQYEPKEEPTPPAK